MHTFSPVHGFGPFLYQLRVHSILFFRVYWVPNQRLRDNVLHSRIRCSRLGGGTERFRQWIWGNVAGIDAIMYDSDQVLLSWARFCKERKPPYLYRWATQKIRLQSMSHLLHLIQLLPRAERWHRHQRQYLLTRIRPTQREKRNTWYEVWITIWLFTFYKPFGCFCTNRINSWSVDVFFQGWVVGEYEGEGSSEKTERLLTDCQSRKRVLRNKFKLHENDGFCGCLCRRIEYFIPLMCDGPANLWKTETPSSWAPIP